MRVFDDGSRAPEVPGWPHLWFEFEPNQFWVGYDEADAHDTRENYSLSGVSVEKLTAMYRMGVWV